MCVDIIQQNRRQAFVTKSLFSSWTSLSPSKYIRIRLLGSEQTAVGGAFNFRYEIFRRATVFTIRCSSHQASSICNFRTEKSQNDESASPAAWSPVRKTGGIFVKKLETPATKYRGLNTVTALLWTKNAPLSMHPFSFFRVVRGVISAVVPQKITGILRRKPLVWFIGNVYHKLYHFGKIPSFCRSDISYIIFYPFNVHLKLGGFVPLLSNGNLQA